MTARQPHSYVYGCLELLLLFPIEQAEQPSCFTFDSFWSHGKLAFPTCTLKWWNNLFFFSFTRSSTAFDWWEHSSNRKERTVHWFEVLQVFHTIKFLALSIMVFLLKTSSLRKTFLPQRVCATCETMNRVRHPTHMIFFFYSDFLENPTVRLKYPFSLDLIKIAYITIDFDKIDSPFVHAAHQGSW